MSKSMDKRLEVQRGKPDIEALRKKALARFDGYNVPNQTIVLFCHHSVFSEILSEPIEHRIDYIIANKPENEIETHLRWIQPYKGHPQMSILDAEREKACAELEKACAELKEADAGWRKAFAERFEACVKWMRAYAEWEKAGAEWDKTYALIFMAEHPDCPWNGKTLFPWKEICQ